MKKYLYDNWFYILAQKIFSLIDDFYNWDIDKDKHEIKKSSLWWKNKDAEFIGVDYKLITLSVNGVLITEGFRFNKNNYKNK